MKSTQSADAFYPANRIKNVRVDERGELQVLVEWQPQQGKNYPDTWVRQNSICYLKFSDEQEPEKNVTRDLLVGYLVNLLLDNPESNSETLKHLRTRAKGEEKIGQRRRGLKTNAVVPSSLNDQPKNSFQIAPSPVARSPRSTYQLRSHRNHKGRSVNK
jgi:hypothetical protein